jgi:cold shock CspA family protein
MSSQRHMGCVKWYDPHKNYGFILRPGEKDIFLPGNELRLAGIEKVETDDLLKFGLVRDQRGRGRRAKGVALIRPAKGD